MKELKLANTNMIALVDDEDYARVSGYKWNAKVISNRVYSITTYIKLVHQPTLANVIMQRYGVQFDHIDRNGLNNSKSYLRVVTQSENCLNRSKSTNCSSKYKGVCWCKFGRNWKAYITRYGKRIYLGRFKDEEAATKAFDAKAKELHGEFAVLNFV